MHSISSLSHSQNQKQQLWQYGVWLLYMTGTLILLLHHEIWKDEAHRWLLARDSDTIANLFYNGRYEGHPKLWNVLLYGISLFTHDPLFVQLLHWILGSAALWFLIFKSPFPNWVRFTLPFSYLLFYEYQVISANYAICVLLLFAICHLLCQSKVRHLWLAILLVLLANANLFGLIIAIGISLGIIYDFIDLKQRQFNFKPLIGFIIICLLGFTLSVYHIIPPSDHFLTANHNNAGFLSGTRINKLVSIFFRGVFHIPNIGDPTVWNSHLLFHYIPDFAKAIVSLLAWLVPIVLFARHRKLLFLFFFCLGGIAVFAYISPLMISVRHSGFGFIMLIVCCWLLRAKTFSHKPSPAYYKSHKWLIASIIGINILSTVLFGYIEITRPFSMSKEVVTYLGEHQLDPLPLISTQNTGTSLSTYLQKPLYYLDKGAMGSYAIWSSSSFTQDKSIIDQNLRTYSMSKDDFCIASEYTFDQDLLGDCWKIEKLASFKGSVVRSEQFELYRVHKNCD